MDLPDIVYSIFTSLCSGGIPQFQNLASNTTEPPDLLPTCIINTFFNMGKV
jgi:hypothetical protein